MEPDLHENPLIERNLLSPHPPFAGDWDITFFPLHRDLRAVWLFLHSLQVWLLEEPNRDRPLKVVRLTEGGPCRCWWEGQAIFVEAPGPVFVTPRCERPEAPAAAVPPVPLERLFLGFFRSPGEPRWESVHLPSSLFFLAAPLHAQGYAVEVAPLDPHRPESLWENQEAPDLLGMTVYEDNFLECRRFLDLMRPSFPGLLAAGGPMVTLAPMASLYHLTAVNLFVRGEAEIALPRILDALRLGDAACLFKEKGVAVRLQGRILLSGFDRVNRPSAEELSALPLDLGFANRGHLQAGLEVTLSRGCRRGCLFCSRVHGHALRALGLDTVKTLVAQFQERRNELGLVEGESATIHINDDDILQDERYAASVFRIQAAAGLRMWGVQTALSSLVTAAGELRTSLLDTLADPGIYVADRPLLWVGTDAFLAKRGRRLGKIVPAPRAWEKLFGFLERSGIAHYHYWISSDAQSTWEEFVAELDRIHGFFKRYSCFGLLPHAPFLVPYASTPIFGRLLESGLGQQVRVRHMLDSPSPVFRYPLVSRVESAWPQLNRLLSGDNPDGGGSDGFFVSLKRKDFFHAWSLVYHYLRQERMGAGKEAERILLRVEARVEKILESLVAGLT